MSRSPRYDVAVVGGGLVGACLAEELARGGASVIVLDAGEQCGDATAKAAGVAVPSLRYLRDVPFYDWMVTAQAALIEDIQRLGPPDGPSFSVTRPIIRLLREQDLAALPSGVSAETAIGRPLSAAQVDHLLPGVRVPADRQPFQDDRGLVISGAAYLGAVRDAAKASGTHWSQGRTVTGLDDDRDAVLVHCADAMTVRADRVVVTAGAWTGALTGLPIGPQRGQLVVLHPATPLGCILSSRLYLAPLPNGDVVAGATEEDSGFVEECTAASLASVLGFAARTVPALAGAAVRQFRSGLRPVSATGRPMVGLVPGRRRVYAAAGHSGHGLVSARLTGRGAAQGLLSGDWNALPEDFCPEHALAGVDGGAGAGVHSTIAAG